MEEKTDTLGLLDMMTRPGFCVKDNVICKVNPAAQALMIEPDTEITSLIQTGLEEYCAMEDGCMCLTLMLSGVSVSANVTVMGDYHIFLLDQQEDQAVFNAMALVARELRRPLDSVMHLTDQLLASTDQTEEAKAQTARLNRGLYQILRIVSNLSYPTAAPSSQEVRDVCAIVEEIMEKAAALLDAKKLRIEYEGLRQSIYTLVDAELLERAILNLLSNAMKFAPEGSKIQVRLTLKGRTLRLQVQDSGSGIAQQVKNDLFYRYLRQPGIEDSRYGLGLGMVLVQDCAAKHGGVVLIDTPEQGGSRITLTIAIRQTSGDRLLSPIHLLTDYLGGRDHMLVELSDCLDPNLFDSEK